MKSSRRKPMVPSFLDKTYTMLEDESFREIISWSELGTEFIIKNPLEFCATVLPKFFKHQNMASFVRQLNMYDFHKSRNDTYEHVFQHPLFLQGKPHLLKDITRKTPEY